MSKIVAFLGSPRKNGYTAKLINRILDGAKAEGAEIITYDLNAEGIKGCQGCFYCRDHEDCATRDALYPMYALDFSPRFPGKKAVTVYAQANPDASRFTDAIESTNGYMKAYGWEVIESLLVYGDVADGYSIPEELLERAYEAGKALAKA